MKEIEFFDQLINIHEKENLTYNEKYIKFRYLLEEICADLTKNSRILFTSLFSKIDYLSYKHNVSKKERWQLNNVRVNANNVIKQNKKINTDEYYFAIKVLSKSIAVFYNSSIPNDLKQLFDKAKEPEFKKQFEGEKIEKIRVTIDKIDFENEIIYCQDEDKIYGDYGNIIVKYNIETLNTEFNSSIELFKEGQQLNLLDVIYKDNFFKPKFIVLEPDYLLDVSAVSECFKKIMGEEINSPLYYFINKFKEKPLTVPIHLGNIANYILDELVNDTSLELNPIIKNSFKEYPVEYTYLFPDDEKLKKFLKIKKNEDTEEEYKNNFKTVENHYNNLKSVIENDLQTKNIDIDNLMLEPSFISENYGIQGRLDLFERKQNKLNIIELKSGSLPFYAGEKLRQNHQAQVILYKLIVSRIFENINNIQAGICYSQALPPENIRWVVSLENLEQKIINIRNEIVTAEYLLAENSIKDVANFVESITKETVFSKDIIDKVDANPKLFWIIKDFVNFTKTLKALTELEKIYFYEFIQFISKEQQENKQLLSKLWNKTDNHENILFDTIENLELPEENIKISEPEQIVIFKRNTHEEQEINFRKGDICIVYPKTNDNDTVLDNQIVKGSIKNITKDEITVYFKYKQRIDTFFKENKKWAIEHDYLDYSFSTMFKSLFSFLNANPEKRKLILGEKEPSKYELEKYDKLSEEQNKIISKALSSKDYFLLLGPPGSGKTSIIIKNLTRELYYQDKKILLLAYTNRAVDEICDAVNNAIINFEDMNNGIVNFGRSDRNFIRIGSELSTDKKHRHNLLDNIAKGTKTRQELSKKINNHKIFISTVSSILSKLHIIEIVNFDVVIIDEASQILEPQIIGILHKIPKFILIGDHKQLPAITLQDKELSKVTHSELNKIGLKNKRNAYFERIYNLCEKNKWYHAFDKLTYQGRMHQEIELFPRHLFYEDKLYIVPLEHQTANLFYNEKFAKNPLERLLSKNRLIFIPSEKNKEDKTNKANSYEAEMVSKIISSLFILYDKNNKEFIENKTVGIITPYRNQIAKIKSELEKNKIPNLENITVDTVERYQGSQRDIIILSFSVNEYYQMEKLVSFDDKREVDRKLNVAITRAKEQLIFIGNEQILSSEKLYFKLIEFVKTKGGYIQEGIIKALENNFIVPDINLEQSVTGKFFEPDSNFKTFFDELVIDTLRNDERTNDYPKYILGKGNDYIRNVVIEYGRADFDQKIIDFEPADRVNLYCFYNMRKHYFSSFAIFDTYGDFFINEFNKSSQRLFFIDFGSGPLTTGLAFNQYFTNKIANFSFNYIGIDISNAMLEKAKQFSKSNLFYKNTNFEFVNYFSEISEEIRLKISKTSNCIILNFSYLFANLSQKQSVKLAENIKQFKQLYPLNNYIILYQNASSDSRNRNYYLFKKQFDNLREKASKREIVSYKNQQQSFYDKTENVFYEILSL